MCSSKMILRYSLLLIVFVNILVKAEISIDNDGGYKNIVVGISPKLNESDVDSVLLQLKALFRETSETLYKTSERKVFFKDIVFIIPKKYHKFISRHVQIEESDAESYRKPDFFLTDNDIYERPYTIQHRGCGYPGLRINIPRQFLTSKVDSKRALALVRQWAHYRYGVFSENGFPDDDTYPECYTAAGSTDLRINDCTNGNATYEIEKKYLNDYGSGNCNPVPIAEKNDHITSSIMTNRDFPKMDRFCNGDTRPHNRDSPNKQNALCREKSTWEVITANEDFQVKSKSTSNAKPAFKYFVDSYHPNLVVAVDTSSEMDLNDRMFMTQNAFSYFMFYDLPYMPTVKLVDMKSKENTLIERTILSESDARWLVEMFPETSGEGESCVHCTIQKLLEVMKLDVNDIIIITATDITSTWVDNIIAMLKSNKVALHVIYFEKDMSGAAFLERIAKSSGGNFFYIPESFPPGFPTSSITVLYEAFRSIYEALSWRNRQRVLVDQMTFTNNCSPTCTLSFPVDRTLQTLQVVVTGTEFGRTSPILRKSIILENGKQQFVSGNDSFTYKSEVPAYVITVQNPQEGKWNLTFERKTGFNKPVVVIVRAKSPNYGDIINMQSWISNNDKNIDNADRPPITIYSEIKKHNKPLIDVEVTALIHQASSNAESYLNLRDDGVGDPDITKNDGIYSKYLTDIVESGYYSITIVAEKKVLKYHKPVTEKSRESHCCGSFIPNHLSYESGYFRRVTTYQSFFVDKGKVGIAYPPRRVTDLRIEKVEILSNNVKCYILKWTAPGDRYDIGKASSYDIKVFKTREAALDDFYNSHILTIQMLKIHGSILEPQEAGTVQTAYVELTNLTSGTYFIALKTTSYTGKISDVSNVVRLFYAEKDPYITDSGFSKGEYYTYPIVDGTEITPSDDSNEDSTNFKLAIGLSCGLLLLMIIIGLFLIIYFGKLKKSKAKPKVVIGQNSKKTESNDALCHSNGDGNISIISPVTSWDANSLVSHYETLQQRKAPDANGMLSIPESKELDNVSLPSSKYSYNSKIEPNMALYDPVYYHQIQSQDQLNYPYNPVYTPFDPMYTSSMRRLDDSNLIHNPYCSDNTSYCSYSLPRNQSSKLKTDV